MGALQMRGCLSAGVRAILRVILITECLLMSVRGDGAGSEEKLEIKYALIGGGIGLFLVAGFIIVKVCFIRKQVHENNTDGRMRRPEPHMLPLSHLSQSEPPTGMVFNGIRC